MWQRFEPYTLLQAFFKLIRLAEVHKDEAHKDVKNVREECLVIKTEAIEKEVNAAIKKAVYAQVSPFLLYPGSEQYSNPL